MTQSLFWRLKNFHMVGSFDFLVLLQISVFIALWAEAIFYSISDWSFIFDLINDQNIPLIWKEVTFFLLRYGIPFINQNSPVILFLFFVHVIILLQKEINFNTSVFLILFSSYRFCYINSDAIFITVRCSLWIIVSTVLK